MLSSWGLNLIFDYDGVEILSCVSDEEAKHERILEAGKKHDVQTFSSPTTSDAKKNAAEGEKTSKLEEHKNDFVMNAPQRNSLIGRNDNDWNNATESKGTGLFAYHL